MKIGNFAVFCFIGIFSLVLMSGSIAFAAGQDMPVIRLGDAGDAVYTLQTELKKRGFYHYDADGKFGSHTKQAVVEFQQTVGIEDDGIAGSATWRALRSYVGSGELSRRNSDRIGQQLVNFAKGFLGVPYVWGGSAPGGFDCSGFVYYVYSQYGVSLPRVADEQYGIGRRVALAEIQPGDLVFFSTYAPGPSHVGIYMGNGRFIHASSAANEVTVTPITKEYYQARFLGAFRVLR